MGAQLSNAVERWVGLLVHMTPLRLIHVDHLTDVEGQNNVRGEGRHEFESLEEDEQKSQTSDFGHLF